MLVTLIFPTKNNIYLMEQFKKTQLLAVDDACLHALTSRQHFSFGIGASVPSGQTFKSIVQIAWLQSKVAFLQAFKLGQHSPSGIGAGVPSGQTLKSIVHIV